MAPASNYFKLKYSNLKVFHRTLGRQAAKRLTVARALNIVLYRLAFLPRRSQEPCQ
jgi:hypothetical protein